MQTSAAAPPRRAAATSVADNSPRTSAPQLQSTRSAGGPAAIRTAAAPRRPSRVSADADDSVPIYKRYLASRGNRAQQPQLPAKALSPSERWSQQRAAAATTADKCRATPPRRTAAAAGPITDSPEPKDPLAAARKRVTTLEVAPVTAPAPAHSPSVPAAAWAAALTDNTVPHRKQSPVAGRRQPSATTNPNATTNEECSGVMGPSYLAASREWGGSLRRRRSGAEGAPVTTADALEGGRTSSSPSAAINAAAAMTTISPSVGSRRSSRPAISSLNRALLVATASRPVAAPRGSYKLLDDDYNTSNSLDDMPSRTQRGSNASSMGALADIEAVLALQRALEKEQARLRVELRLRREREAVY